jgi:hypothetical protein
MKLAAMALVSMFALSGTCGFAHTVPRGSDVRTHTTYRNAAPPVVLQPNYGNSNGNFSGYGIHDGGAALAPTMGP